jgi:hypothetical protein
LITGTPDPVAYLRSLVIAPIPVEELDWRDFKADPGKEHERKQLWSKAVSGFANNQGGVLVWGLDARKVNDVDRVCDECPVEKPFVFKSRLIELHRDAADPPLPNVEYEAYPLPSDPDKGFVVCFIPEGSHKPYRAMYCPNKPFYLRSGDSFLLPSVSVLRSLFYPKTEAVFEVTVELGYIVQDKKDGGIPSAVFSCVIYVGNRGRATAKDLYVIGNTSCARSSLTYDSGSDWSMDKKPDGTVTWTGMRPLHPGMEFGPARMGWSVRTVVQHERGGSRDVPPVEGDIRLRLAFYAEGQEPQEVEFAFPLDELRALKGRAVTQVRKTTPAG